MYDVDGNGVIDQEEMTKIVQVKPVKQKNLVKIKNLF
jgi:Ca2+-binding EF-hand superfamily protein